MFFWIGGWIHRRTRMKQFTLSYIIFKWKTIYFFSFRSTSRLTFKSEKMWSQFDYFRIINEFFFSCLEERMRQWSTVVRNGFRDVQCFSQFVLVRFHASASIHLYRCYSNMSGWLTIGKQDISHRSVRNSGLIYYYWWKVKYLIGMALECTTNSERFFCSFERKMR